MLSSCAGPHLTIAITSNSSTTTSNVRSVPVSFFAQNEPTYRIGFENGGQPTTVCCSQSVAVLLLTTTITTRSCVCLPNSLIGRLIYLARNYNLTVFIKNTGYLRTEPQQQSTTAAAASTILAVTPHRWLSFGQPTLQPFCMHGFSVHRSLPPPFRHSCSSHKSSRHCLTFNLKQPNSRPIRTSAM